MTEEQLRVIQKIGSKLDKKKYDLRVLQSLLSTDNNAELMIVESFARMKKNPIKIVLEGKWIPIVLKEQVETLEKEISELQKQFDAL